MFILLHEWINSLRLFSLNRVGIFLNFFLHNFFKAVKFFIQNFWWLFLVDALFFVYFGDLLLKIPVFSADLTQQVNSTALFLHSVYSCIFFILASTFLLSIRKPFEAKDRSYFKSIFLRYVQLQLILSLVFLFFINLLLCSGISTFPEMHWSLSVFLSLIELLIVFYWLDSNFKLKEILYSFEKALNLFLYNIPFFILVAVCILIFKFVLGFLFAHFGFEWRSMQILGKIRGGQFVNFPVNSFTTLNAIKFLAMKYVAFFVDYFFIALIFAFYFFKKDEVYATSVFQVKEQSEE